MHKNVSSFRARHKLINFHAFGDIFILLKNVVDPFCVDWKRVSPLQEIWLNCGEIQIALGVREAWGTRKAIIKSEIQQNIEFVLLVYWDGMEYDA